MRLILMTAIAMTTMQQRIQMATTAKKQIKASRHYLPSRRFPAAAYR